MTEDLEAVALALVADGKGLLAADETVPTLTKRFETLGIQSTEKSRRTYREMLFTAGAADFISGVILQDETIRQNGSDGMPLVKILSEQGILPGIKVDTAPSRSPAPRARRSPRPRRPARAPRRRTARSAPVSRSGAR